MPYEEDKNLDINKISENTFCCEKFKKIMEEPESVYDRKITFFLSTVDGKWYTDFSDGEYGDIELTFCPFCSIKLLGKKQ